MHDATNTLGGRLGFFVLYADGRRVSEHECLWDEVSRAEPIVAFGLADFVRDVALMDLRGYEKFYFSNEAVSLHQVQAAKNGLITTLRDKPVVVAKIFGGVKGTLADEVRIALIDGIPKMDARRTKPVGDLRFALHVYRPGVATV